MPPPPPTPRLFPTPLHISKTLPTARQCKYTSTLYLEHRGVEEVDQPLLCGADGDVTDEELDLALHLRRLRSGRAHTSKATATHHA